MDIVTILKQAVADRASDVFLVAGLPCSFRVNGVIHQVDDERLLPPDTDELLQEIYRLAGERDMTSLLEKGDDDFAFAIPGVSRFRVSAYKQRGALSAVIRVITFQLPDYTELGIPPYIIHCTSQGSGMILITGPAGSGKSTTLACIIDRINHTRKSHIITIEDPIEFLHSHKQSIISQREVSHDTGSYADALRGALRQSPNVILLGEMRDFSTINTVLTAAETGQLVLSTLHTVGAAKTVDRIVDVFPADQQRQVRVQLSMVLEGVVSQQLIPTKDGGLVPAFEIMKINSAIRNLIREGKTHQIDNAIFSGGAEGMRTMDSDILSLYKQGIITKENALLYAVNPELLEKKL